MSVAQQLRILGVAASALLPGEIVVDLFAGGGGASAGIHAALGVPPAVAVNHSAHAIEAHRRNHPETEHLLSDVWEVKPHAACRGRPVGLLWASPDCRHFSRAKGSAPVSKAVRSLAWVVVEWAAAVAPRVICLENVPEFQTWGPLLDDGRPDGARAGETFREFVGQLRALGYVVDWRVLCAADYGVPTIRRRLFLVARRDGLPIRWPEPTHGKGRALPWRAAAEVIDWTIPCPSIFTRKRPLAEKTCRRIAAGVARYVLQGQPFLVPMNGEDGHRSPRTGDLAQPLGTVVAGAPRHGLVAPFFVPRYGEREGQAPRAMPVSEPMPTIVRTGNGAQLVAAFLAKHNGGAIGAVGQSLREPVHTVTGRNSKAVVAAHLCNLYGSAGAGATVSDPLPTVTGQGGHAALVASFLVQYYGSGGQHSDPRDPLPTVVSRARHGLVTVSIDGADYVLADIGMRMLSARELAAAQGFPADYWLPDAESHATRLVGNSVCPQVAEALLRANLCGAA